MNAVVAMLVAGGALVALETMTPNYTKPIVLGLDDLLGRPKTFRDGKYSPEEKSYCEAQAELVRQFKALDIWEQAKLCKNNPRDLRCRALDEHEICELEKWSAGFVEDIKDNPVWDGIVGLPGAIIDVIAGVVTGVFGDVAWLLLAGGLAYLVLVHR